MWTKQSEKWVSEWISSLRQSGKRDHLLPDIPISAEAFLSIALAYATKNTVLWICDGPRTLETFWRDLQSLNPFPDLYPCLYPAIEARAMHRDTSHGDPELTGLRLSTLVALADRHVPMIATCIQAIMAAAPSPTRIQQQRMIFRRGEECRVEEKVLALEKAGYRFCPEVQNCGEASMRGGLLDLWPIDYPSPVRIEFFGDTIESIRIFDVLSQRSLERRDEISAIPVKEIEENQAATIESLADHLPEGAIVIWSDLTAIDHYAGINLRTAADSGQPSPPFTPADLRKKFARDPTSLELFIGSGPEEAVPLTTPDFKPVPAMGNLSRNTLPPDAIAAARRHLLEDLVARQTAGYTVRLFLDTPGALSRFKEIAGEFGHHLAAEAKPLSGGFISSDLRLCIAGELDLYGRRLQRRRRAFIEKASPETTPGMRVTDWTDMEPGDLVVHVEHGIGRYLGLREINTGSTIAQEVLAIEYADNAKLYVPVSQAHLLTRYVGLSKRITSLHQIGGKRWSREKESAEKAIEDMAAQLLETQAARETLPGFAFSPDTAWQHEFEAAFPYEETRDQDLAITAVKADMEKMRPMDRLLCGDAGYGKTEVALRAAFKAIMQAKQVAVLVPTTVLAQQHFDTFTERMAAFPITVAMMSRFCSHGEHQRVCAGLRDGSIDIVIGTHGLIQPSIVFRDLGLVIIDEEQRFGVKHKERFKQIRQMVDVLTLTATPIPRTLYLSLTGARDLSTIQTPPQDRVAVETIISKDHDDVIRDAILKEMNREGQVYFIHNRVMTIERVHERVRRLVPEARIAVAHGEMAAGILAEVMEEFSAGNYDVLISTTIVESGLDIPNANTIIIDRADRFGLAELYQLRGRVGRSNQKAYAYLLLPGQAVIDPIARKRIQAITHYSDLGAGFRLAMRDLEIRGAGNLLGSEQSGHITSVGFGLYCQLLKRTIARHQGETPPPVADVELRLDFMDLSPAASAADNSAVIPFNFIEDERLRVSLYRKIAETALPKDVDALEEEFRDRFGRFPPPIQRLLLMARIRTTAATRRITAIETREEKIMAAREGQFIMPGGHFPRFRKKTPGDKLKELLKLINHI